MLSKRTKYAFQALLYLAERQKGPVLISEIAENERIPRKFLELILLDLKNQGILQSKKGKGGGYLLGRPPESIYLGQVIRLFDGPLALLPCVSVTAHRKCDECADEEACRIRKVMKRVRDVTADILDRTSLASMLRPVELEDNIKRELRRNII